MCDLVAVCESLARSEIVDLLAEGVPARQRRRRRAAELTQSGVDVAVIAMEQTRVLLEQVRPGAVGADPTALVTAVNST